MDSPNPPWAELVQLIPVIVLASTFIAGGEVDLARAAPLFVVAAILTVPIQAAVVYRGHTLNPILIGTAIWLWIGAVAFNVPMPTIAAWIGETQGFGIFAAALGMGIATAWTSTGYVGTRHPDPRWIRRASLGLLVLTVAAVAWSWGFRHDVRLGGGLPFIVLNVARRILVARAPGR